MVKKQRIKIDYASIIENEHYDKKSSGVISYMRNIASYFKEVTARIKKNGAFVTETRKYIGLGFDETENGLELVEPELIDTTVEVGWTDKGNCTRIWVERPVTPLYNIIPQRMFNYKHFPTKITCEECCAEFLHTELLSDEAYDGGYTDKKCPVCGEWDCCNLHYEWISDKECALILG